MFSDMTYERIDNKDKLDLVSLKMVHLLKKVGIAVLIENYINQEEEKTVQYTPEELARIDDYAQRMHDPKNGVEIKDRKYKLKTYPSCFLGN